MPAPARPIQVSGPEEGTPNEQNLIDLREATKNVLLDLASAKETIVQPAIQEVILAERHLEDARMRLGRALSFVKGQDPLETK